MKTIVMLVSLVLMQFLSINLAHAYQIELNGEICQSDSLFLLSSEGASRGYDGMDWINRYISDSSIIHLAIYKQNGVDGWDSDNSFLETDARPYLQAGEVETYNNIYLWAGTNMSPQDIVLRRYRPVGTFILRLVQIPNGVSYSGPTEWSGNVGTFVLPFYATDNPFDGYKFQLKLSDTVPEPSSLLALAGGFAGFGGLALRRRIKR